MAYWPGSADLTKIDSAAADGLTGTADSVAYRVAEIEQHVHHYSRWLCAAKVPTATHFADAITGVDPDTAFSATAGNKTWGTAVQVLGADDTPVIAGQVRCDPHKILVVSATGALQVYCMRVIYGATAAAGVAAGTYSDIMWTTSTAIRNAPTEIGIPRAAADTNLWVQVYALGTNGGTVTFYVGLHEYEG